MTQDKLSHSPVLVGEARTCQTVKSMINKRPCFIEPTTHHYNETTETCINNMRYRHLKLQEQAEGKIGPERMKTHWMEIHVLIGKADQHPFRCTRREISEKFCR